MFVTVSLTAHVRACVHAWGEGLTVWVCACVCARVQQIVVNEAVDVGRSYAPVISKACAVLAEIDVLCRWGDGAGEGWGQG